MKPRMMSKPAMDHLFDHVLDGHAKTFEGINNLKDLQLIDEQGYIDLLKKNSERLIARIHEFKIIHRIVSILFACLFGYMQMGCEDLEMRRARRMRTRRRNETENLITL
jgi:hypothetical protein